MNRDDVNDLYADYDATLDDRNLEGWLSLFTESCSYVVTTKENVDQKWAIALISCETRGMMVDRIAAIQKTMYFLPRQQRRLASGLRVRDGQAQSSFAVYESVAAEPTKLLATGRTFDVLQYEEGRLKFASRRYVLDSSIVLNSLIYPL